MPIGHALGGPVEAEVRWPARRRAPGWSAGRCGSGRTGRDPRLSSTVARPTGPATARAARAAARGDLAAHAHAETRHRPLPEPETRGSGLSARRARRPIHVVRGVAVDRGDGPARGSSIPVDEAVTRDGLVLQDERRPARHRARGLTHSRGRRTSSSASVKRRRARPGPPPRARLARRAPDDLRRRRRSRVLRVRRGGAGRWCRARPTSGHLRQRPGGAPRRRRQLDLRELERRCPAGPDDVGHGPERRRCRAPRPMRVGTSGGKRERSRWSSPAVRDADLLPRRRAPTGHRDRARQRLVVEVDLPPVRVVDRR